MGGHSAAFFIIDFSILYAAERERVGHKRTETRQMFCSKRLWVGILGFFIINVKLHHVLPVCLDSELCLQQMDR